MKNMRLLSLIFLIAFTEVLLAKSPCELNGWSAHNILLTNGEKITLYSFQRSPGYLPGHSLAPQVVVLNGGTGSVECRRDINDETDVMYRNIGSIASIYGRQAITLDLNYWQNGRNTVQKAAARVVDVLNELVSRGYLRSSYYLVGGSAGTAIMSAALDYHPSFMNRVERAIFVSGPFTGLGKYFIQNNVIRGLMNQYYIPSLDSLDPGMAYNPTRYNQWIKPIMNKKGLRFYMAQDDDVFCLDNHNNPFKGYECRLGAMDVEFLNWLEDATDGTENRVSLEKLGILRIYKKGGHDLMKTHPELLNSAFMP